MAQPLAITTYEQTTLIVVPTIFLVIAAITVVMRFNVRQMKQQRLFVDDYLCLTALILTFGCYVTLLLCVRYGGLGMPVESLSLDNIDFVFKALTAISVLWGTTVAVVQASILVLYIRVFSIVTWHKYTCYGALAAVIGWWISWFVTSLTTCIPLDKFWEPTVPGVCIDDTKFCIGSGLSHLILDIFILTFSLPIVWGLKTSFRNKSAISIACSLGLFATLSGLLRMDCLVSLIPYDPTDFTQSAWLGTMFELLENECGIICSCMPMFPALLTRIADSNFAGSVRGFFSDVRGSGIRSSVRRLLSTQRSSPGQSTSGNGAYTNATQAWGNRKRSDDEYSDIYASGRRNHEATASGNAGSFHQSDDIPLRDVNVTKTWTVQ